MENHIIVFLALLWACFAAEETAPNLRRRELRKDMKAVCADLHDYGNGFHTLWVPKEKERWMHRWPGVTLGECKHEDKIKTRSDESEEPFCRLFGGNSGTYCTIWAPEFFADFLLDTGAKRNKCTMKNQGDEIDIEHRSTGTAANEAILCLDINPNNGEEYHTIEVSTPSDDVYDWLWDRSEPEGYCYHHDNDYNFDDDPHDLCVKINFGGNDNEWYTVETEWEFDDWWTEEAMDFEDGTCDGNGINEAGTITMHHYDTVNEDILCLDINPNNGEEYHTIEVSTPSDDVYDWLWDRSEPEGYCYHHDNDYNFDDDPHDLCVKINFGGNDNEWYTVETEWEFDDWWTEEAMDFEDGTCDGNGINDAGTITMYHYDDYNYVDHRYVDEEDIFCMEINLNTNLFDDDYEDHTIEVSAPYDAVYDWFEDRSESVGQCQNDHTFESNNDPKIYCVKLDLYGQNVWFDLDSDEFFEDWWDEEALKVKEGSCASNDKNDDGMITMLHYV